MASIKCPECGRAVNEEAAACPHCGCPASEWQASRGDAAWTKDGFADYYAVLGIAPDASPTQMAKAYRDAALKHHPDRGGSHRRMTMVNEAWFILSNPEERRVYDQLRTQRMDAAARAGWSRRTEDVRRKAQEYPRQWSAFERWMKGIMDDIRAAEYGKVQGGGVAWPTAGKSSSGWGFIVVGGLIGGVLGCVAFVASGSHGGALRFYLIFAAAGGAWVGAKVHGFLRETIGGGHATGTKAGTRPTARQDKYGKGQDAAQQPQVSEVIQHETLRCPKCGQPLRVPSLDKEITVTCPKCRNKFTKSSPVT